MTDSFKYIYKPPRLGLFFQGKTQDRKITLLASTVLTKQSPEINNKQILEQTSSGGDYTNKFSF